MRLPRGRPVSLPPSQAWTLGFCLSLSSYLGLPRAGRPQGSPDPASNTRGQGSSIGTMLPSVPTSGCLWPLPDPEPGAPPGTPPVPGPWFLVTWLSVLSPTWAGRPTVALLSLPWPTSSLPEPG